MSPERYQHLSTSDETLSDTEIEAGWHCCPDWDFLLIGPGFTELEGCTCHKDHHKAMLKAAPTGEK